MKILLVNAYLRNTGDAALSSVLIKELRQAWPGAEIIVSSVEEPADWPAFEGSANIGSIRLYAGLVDGGKIRRILRKVLLLIVEVGWGRLPKKLRGLAAGMLPSMVADELRALDTADLIISTAGGYLSGDNSMGGNLSVRYMLLPLKLAVETGKPIILAPQSYGAFGNRYQETAVRRVLSEARGIMTRESKSFELLKQLGIPERLLIQSVDMAFAFEPRLKKSPRNTSKNPHVGITTRSWSSPAKQKSYEKALADFVVAVQRRYNARVTLISHVIKDVYSNDGSAIDRSIAALAREAGAAVEQIDTLRDHYAMKKIYDSLDFIVGTRFHSVIFSLTSGVPAIAIEYQHKTSGIMQDLGLGQWVVGFDDVTADKLLAMFDELTKSQAAYRRQLYRVLPDYITEARQTGAVIKRFTGSRQLRRPKMCPKSS